MRILHAICIMTTLSPCMWSRDLNRVSPNTLIGCWQANSPVVSAGPDSCYRFFKDCRFIFEFSSYIQPNRILELHGKYSMQNNSIFFSVLNRVEYSNGSVLIEPLSNTGWTIENGKKITIKQTNQQPQETYINLCPQTPDKITCIEIGSIKFYKMSPNPKHRIGEQ